MGLVAVCGTEVQLPVRNYETPAYRLKIRSFLNFLRSLAASSTAAPTPAGEIFLVSADHASFRKGSGKPGPALGAFLSPAFIVASSPPPRPGRCPNSALLLAAGCGRRKP